MTTLCINRPAQILCPKKFLLARLGDGGRLQTQDSWRVAVSLAAPPENFRILSGVDLRRSTRLDGPVRLMVLGQTRLGLSFQERTSTVSFNLHGCRYPSRHDYSIGAWIGLKVMESDGQTT